MLVSADGVANDVSFALRLAAMPMGSEALTMLRVPGALPAIRLFGRAIEIFLGSTKFGRDAADVVDLPEGFRDPSSLSASAHLAVGGGRARPVRHHAGSKLSGAIHSGADNLGRRRPRDPGRPCSAGPRGDAWLAPGNLRQLRAHALPRPPGSLRRGRRTIHRLDRLTTTRTSCARCYGPATSRTPLSVRSTPRRVVLDGCLPYRRGLGRQRTTYLGAGIQHQQDQGAQGVVGQAATGKVVAQHHVRGF